MIISTISGGTLETSEITFNPETYHFADKDGNDVTDDIRRVDKLFIVPTFDVEKDNARLYNKKAHGQDVPLAPLDDSTTSILAHQLATDPLGAPLDALDAGVAKITASKGIQVILVGAVILLVALVIIEKKAP